LVSKVSLVNRAYKENRARLAHKVFRVLRDLKEPLVSKDSLVNKVFKVSRVK